MCTPPTTISRGGGISTSRKTSEPAIAARRRAPAARAARRGTAARPRRRPTLPALPPQPLAPAALPPCPGDAGRAPDRPPARGGAPHGRVELVVQQLHEALAVAAAREAHAPRALVGDAEGEQPRMPGRE